MENPLANGPIGTRHGEMGSLVKNPFRTKFMRDNYDAAVKVYDAKHKDFITPSGRRSTGNAWANNFWRGFDGYSLNWDRDSKQTAAYAMFCAGRDIAKIVTEKSS